MTKRSYSCQGKAFTLEQVSNNVIKVTHRDQTGRFGIHEEWDPLHPFSCTTIREDPQDLGKTWEKLLSPQSDDGIRFSLSRAESPDQALDHLCTALLEAQRKADAQRTNPVERKAAAQQLLREFMDELPEELLQEKLPEETKK